MMRTWLLAALVLLAGCHASGGRLVIAGGAVDPSNAAVYHAFLRGIPANGTIGVVPTASADPSESAAAAQRTLTKYAGDRRVAIIDITEKSLGSARDPEVVRLIDSCAALWFTGGDQSRIVAAFRPAAGDTPAFEATKRLLQRGGTIGGSSAGAAMMSDPMITGGASEQALMGKSRTGKGDTGLGIGRGMGFFEFGLTDQHFLRRGRLGRLVVALERTGVCRGYAVEENSAVLVDGNGHIEVLSGTLIVLDGSKLKRSSSGWSGLRLSMLRAGDGADGRTGRITSASDGQRTSGDVSASLPAAWSPNAVEMAMLRLKPASGNVDLESEGFVVRFGADEQTRFHGTAERPSIIDATLEILVRR